MTSQPSPFKGLKFQATLDEPGASWYPRASCEAFKRRIGKPEKRTSLRDIALMDGNLKLFGPDFVANPHCRGPGRTRTTLKGDEGD